MSSEWSRPRWHSLPSRFVKLNIDGCLKDNPGVSGGGGILRSTEGRLLFAFSVYLGQCTSLQAEAMALLLGLQLGVQRGGLDNLVVESNSMMLVWILWQKSRCPWSIDGEVEKILQLTRGGVQVVHYYREANTVADVLSNVGWANPEQRICVYETFAGLPFLARGHIVWTNLLLPPFADLDP